MVGNGAGLLTALGRPTYLDNSRTRLTVLAVGAGGVIWIVFLSPIISLFSLSLSLSLSLSGTRLDIDRNTVLKSREIQNNQPFNQSLKG